MIVEQRFQQLQAPMSQRKQVLERQKRVYQFLREVEDEKLWIEEKLPLAESPNVGTSLLSVQQMLRRHRFLRTEVRVTFSPSLSSLSTSHSLTRRSTTTSLALSWLPSLAGK